MFFIAFWYNFSSILWLLNVNIHTSTYVILHTNCLFSPFAHTLQLIYYCRMIMINYCYICVSKKLKLYKNKARQKKTKTVTFICANVKLIMSNTNVIYYMDTNIKLFE